MYLPDTLRSGHVDNQGSVQLNLFLERPWNMEQRAPEPQGLQLSGHVRVWTGAEWEWEQQRQEW